MSAGTAFYQFFVVTSGLMGVAYSLLFLYQTERVALKGYHYLHHQEDEVQVAILVHTLRHAGVMFLGWITAVVATVFDDIRTVRMLTMIGTAAAHGVAAYFCLCVKLYHAKWHSQQHTVDLIVHVIFFVGCCGNIPAIGYTSSATHAHSHSHGNSTGKEEQTNAYSSVPSDDPRSPNFFFKPRPITHDELVATSATAATTLLSPGSATTKKDFAKEAMHASTMVNRMKLLRHTFQKGVGSSD